ncbi:HAUS augmin-like complex subunit 8 isoform X2 [Nannospalax galili]|nr:HAUS augmin-like complex subunit 8 isoform X2 [Nannospalax galili]
MAKGNLQSTMLEGPGTALPELELSAISDKSMVKKTPHVDRMMPKKAAAFKAPRKKSPDLQEAMDMMESQTLLLTLLTVKMENNLVHLEAKAEKDLQILCRERERLQAQVLQLRRQLLLSQKQQELNVALDTQIEMLSPFEAVAEQFREQYKKLATALDTTRHELPTRAIHLQGSGEELLDALQPALRTTFQLLGELGVDTTDASTQALCLLGELKDAIVKKDLELRRSVSQVLELSAEVSKEAALMNQEVWEEAQGAEACSQWYFSPDTVDASAQLRSSISSQDSKPGACDHCAGPCPPGGLPE